MYILSVQELWTIMGHFLSNSLGLGDFFGRSHQKEWPRPKIFIKIIGKLRLMAFPDSKNPSSSKVVMVLWGTADMPKRRNSFSWEAVLKVSGNWSHWCALHETNSAIDLNWVQLDEKNDFVRKKVRRMSMQPGIGLKLPIETQLSMFGGSWQDPQHLNLGTVPQHIYIYNYIQLCWSTGISSSKPYPKLDGSWKLQVEIPRLNSWEQHVISSKPYPKARQPSKSLR